LQIYRRLLVGFVPGTENPLRGDLIARLQALLLLTDAVLNKENSAAAPKQTIPKFHRHPHGC